MKVSKEIGVVIAGRINSFVVAHKMQFEAQKRGDRRSEKLWLDAEKECAVELIKLGIPVVGYSELHDQTS
jgi:hypothetical protein